MIKIQTDKLFYAIIKMTIVPDVEITEIIQGQRRNFQARVVGRSNAILHSEIC